MPATVLAKPIGRAVRWVWRRLPQSVLDTPQMRRVGTLIYDRHTRHMERAQSHATYFLRNMAQIEVVRDLIADLPQNATLRIASIACSNGAELYSYLHVLRSARPDLDIAAHGVDISETIVEVARKGVYDPARRTEEGLVAPGTPAEEIAGLEALCTLLERTPDSMLRVKDRLREGVTWSVCDASSPEFVERLGTQDIVLANNFLGPMDDDLAEACLRNAVRLAKDGGILVVDGVDLDLRARVAEALGLEPVTTRMEEIHFGDATKLDWPWTRWSVEPLDMMRPDRDFRYATIFRVMR